MAPSTEASRPAKAAAGTLKRKRPATESRDAKKKRVRSESSNDDDDNAPKSKIFSLEAAIFESKKNYNNITIMITIAKQLDEHGNEDENNQGGKDEEEALLAVISLCRVFIRLLAAGALLRKKNLADKEIVVVHWLRERLAEYHQVLRFLLLRDGLAMTALTLSMRLLKAEGQYPQSENMENNFPKGFLKDIVAALCQTSVDQAVRHEFVDKFADEYDDVRFYTFKAVTDIIREQASMHSRPSLYFDSCFDLLCSIEGVPESAEELNHFYVDTPTKKKGHETFSISKHKKQAQDAWLALMTLKMDSDRRKCLLGVMARVIAPWFTKPELLMDFLTDCYNSGGSMSLLALSGVFYLIQERNLDYPAFYTKLYSLLDSEILHSRHRSKFFRLLDTFLASSHLPVALVASFIKRLARLSLNAPPSAIVTIIPWMYNLFKKHPTCTFMMHRVPRTDEEKEIFASEGLEDPFQPDVEDPMETGAIDSCIWEVVQLQSHYHPNVATIAKIVSEQFTKQFYTMEDFLDHSYASLLEAELVKNVKKAPVVDFQIPPGVFFPYDADSGHEDCQLTKMWDFK